jgi:hypothetical protein
MLGALTLTAARTDPAHLGRGCGARANRRAPEPRTRRALHARGHATAIVHENAAFAQPKLPIFAAALIAERDRVDLHDVIWLIVLSTALIMLWGSSDHWDLAGLWRRVGHALHLDHDAHGSERQR